MNHDLSTADRTHIVLDEERPWPGLVSFTEINQHYFFGREQESNELVRLIEAEFLTILYGQSGLGKSSLLQAGIAPLLRALQFVPIYMRLNLERAAGDERPASATDAIWNRLAEIWAAENIAAPPRRESESLWEYFHRRSCDWWDQHNRLVRPILIFDQFEELLTARRDGSEAQRARLDGFISELADLIENRPPQSFLRRSAEDGELLDLYDFEGAPCRVVISLRDDFLADIEDLRSQMPSVMSNRFCLRALAGEQALDAIIKPGWRVVSPEVAVEIALFVSSTGTQSASTSSPRETLASRLVDPALLSVVLEELNNTRIEKKKPRITSDLLGDGRAEAILRNYYERQLADESEAVREFVVDHLLTASGARNKIAEEDACAEPGISIEVIDRLIRKRLVQRERSGAVKWLELTHDRLAEVVRLDRLEQESRRQQSAAAAARAAAAEAQREAEAALAREGEALERLLDETTIDTVAVVKRNLRQLAADTREFTSPQLLLMSARVEAAAAEILISRGYVTEGIEAATGALDVIGRIGGQAGAPDPRSVRGGAFYVLGTGKRSIGDLNEAEAALRAALESLDGCTGAAERRIRNNATIALGSTLLDHGQATAAADTFQKAIDDLAGEAAEGSAFLMATALLRLAARGQILDRPVFRRAESLVQQHLRAHPQSLRWRLLKAETSIAEGFDTVESSGAAKSRVRLREALREATSVYSADPDNLEARRTLSQIHRLLGMHYASTGDDRRKAWAEFERMREHADAICSQQPDWVVAVRTKAISLYHLAEFDPDGQPRLEEGCHLVEALAARARGHVVVNRDLALFYSRLGMAAPDHERALALFDKAAGTLAQAPAAVRESADYQSIAANILLNAAYRRRELGRSVEEVRTDYRSALAALSAALSAEPLPTAYCALAAAHGLFAAFLMDLADAKGAAAEFRSALDVCSRGLAEHPANVALLEKKMAAALDAAQSWRTHGDLNEAAAFMTLAIGTTVEAIAVEPNSYALCHLAKKVHEEGVKIDSAGGQEAGASWSGTLRSALERIEPDRLLWSAAPATQWDVPPLMQAGWRELTRAEQREEVQRLAESGRGDLAGRIGRMRAAFLSFYPDGILYEAEVLRPGAPAAVFGYVRSGSEMLVLNGSSQPIHAFNENEAVGLLLESATQAADYARFFAAAIQSTLGNFRIVAQLDEIPMLPSADGDRLARLQKEVIPLQLCEAADGAWDFKATVRYGHSLFNSLFRVPPNGVVRIEEDRAVASNLPLLEELFEDGLRIVRPNPRDRHRQLQQAGEWAAAASEQQHYVDTIRAREDMTPAGLAAALVQLAWDQLHARDFDGAFRSSDEARRLDPSAIVIDTNLAHALLLLGRIDEARAIYDKHLGEMVGDKTWQQVILEDFDLLAKAGITHPEMDRLRDEMARRSS